ncbi:uncharacterized protein N7482_001000 [Penicillium canariense]|uniref:F-box domain-containing protein n=1 Tax=Penicillium canariense TaxID=189055 RepID=A0A9W9IEC1_9EURO|nr:uncharacterized protein N7482_001000 [Penicillium canariense]KAJ5175123.1 hypothetical protein N7482_001000 [Penicillium canariense]
MTATSSSATNRVFATPEVLEIVLLQMDMRTLLTSAQRVCRGWMDLITKSPAIQKALFFTPIKESEWGNGAKTLNPLLADLFPSIFPAKTRESPNPLTFSNLKMTQTPTNMFPFVRGDASWRKMLIQQPPISEFGVLSLTHGRGGDSAATFSIPNDEKMQNAGYGGLRMERLFEFLLLSPEVQFLVYTRARVYWSTEEPIMFGESHKEINDRFHQMMEKYDLVVYTREVLQCSWHPRPPSAAEVTRREIIAAYQELGLETYSKVEGIEKAEGVVSTSRWA